MSSRRQRSIPLGGRYRQVSLYQWMPRHVRWLHHSFPSVWSAMFVSIISSCYHLVMGYFSLYSDLHQIGTKLVLLGYAWWHGHFFHVIGPLWGECTCHRWIPFTKTLTRSFDIFLWCELNKRLSKQWSCWKFETPSRSCDVMLMSLSLSNRSNPDSIWISHINFVMWIRFVTLQSVSMEQ